jgi:hypothetical protein
MSKIIAYLLVLFFFSCAAVTPSKESPMVYFSNNSPDPITNIRCKWPSGNVLTLAGLNPGDSRSQSFYISSNDVFFGTIDVTWTNANGESMSKAFNLRKEHLPDIDSGSYSYVQLYFDQEDIEIVTSDIADLGGKIKRMERMLAKYHNDYAKTHGKGAISLITVQPVKDSSLPNWLSGK